MGVPAGEATKPSLAPIAARMTEERRKVAEAELPSQPHQSRRERMDRERQAARRERANESDDTREGRHAYRGVGNTRDVKITPSGSIPVDATRRDRSVDVARPDVVRSGSGAKASGARPSQREGERNTQQQTKNPYRR